jgi:hypothetical protein
MRPHTEAHDRPEMQHCPPFALEEEHAAILRTEYLSIIAASTGPDNVPSLARALGCRVSSDLRQVRLLFCASGARELLKHISANGRIAVVFSLPSTAVSLQLKGFDARLVKTESNDLDLARSYRAAFVEHVRQLGYAAHLIDALVACEPDDLATVTFTPAEAFSQTPGPGAGRAVGVGR